MDHGSQGPYDETRMTLPRIIHVYAGLRHCLLYLKDLLILGNSRDPKNQFVVVLKLHSVTAYTPSPASPISFG
jgi:hypothetical protein